MRNFEGDDMSDAAFILYEAAGDRPEADDKACISLPASAEKYLVDIQRFSQLSGELTAFLSELSEKIRSSAEQLKMMEQAVTLKSEDLKRLHGIEVAAVDLEQLVENQRLQKEQFESFVAGQLNMWNEEKARLARENEELLENLKIQRQREEEEYRLQWETEKSKAKQELAEELQAIQKKNRANQEALEKDFLKRELLLKEKELEWMQLAQELEQFISKLGRRAQSQFR
jgi:hypothetical protein